jgi:hypothetical protein
VSPEETVTSRPAPGKQKRYAIGTTAKVHANGHEFFCVALTHTNTTSLQSSASSADLHCALRGVLRKARSACSGDVLNIPLIGSGLARTGIKANIIVDMILLAIFDESKREKVTNEIRIVLPTKMRGKIDLTTIHRGWE